MVIAILCVLGLFVVQTLLPASFRYLLHSERAQRLPLALGPRDSQPSQSILGERSQRALVNMQEALPVFITVALLNFFRSVDQPLALQGAWIFLLARVLYIPAYLFGISGLRSIIWCVSWVGLALMIKPLL